MTIPHNSRLTAQAPLRIMRYCLKDFQRFMPDTEIYVDRIADMRVNDMNAVLEAVRQMALMKNGGEENDLHLRTLEVAQIREDEYFGSLIADDLKGILRDIRSEHRPDTMTADEVSFAENIQNQLRDAMNFEGSSEEKQIRAFMATIGLDYDTRQRETEEALKQRRRCGGTFHPVIG